MSQPTLLRIDDPADRILRKPVCRIRGWCAGLDWADCDRIAFRIGDGDVPWRLQSRADVTAVHPEMSVTGFTFDLDLSYYLYAVRSSELAISVVVPGAPKIELRFSVAPGLTATCLAAAAVL